MSKTIDSQTLEAIHLFAATISKEVQFKKIILFGSRARQSHNPDSDADLAIVLEEPYLDFIEIKLKLNDIAYSVLLETDIRIQPLPLNLVEWINPQVSPNPQLILNIKNEGCEITLPQPQSKSSHLTRLVQHSFGSDAPTTPK